MPVPGYLTPEPDLSWVDPRVLDKAAVAVKKGTYPSQVAFVNHALRTYYKIKN